MNKSDFIEHLKPLLPAGGDASELETGAQALAGHSPEDRDLLAAVHESPSRLTTLEQFREFPCIRRRETTVEPFKSDTPTAEIRHSFRWSDSWGCKRGNRLICQPPRRLT